MLLVVVLCSCCCCCFFFGATRVSTLDFWSFEGFDAGSAAFTLLVDSKTALAQHFICRSWFCIQLHYEPAFMVPPFTLIRCEDILDEFTDIFYINYINFTIFGWWISTSNSNPPKHWGAFAQPDSISRERHRVATAHGRCRLRGGSLLAQGARTLQNLQIKLFPLNSLCLVLWSFLIIFAEADENICLQVLLFSHTLAHIKSTITQKEQPNCLRFLW